MRVYLVRHAEALPRGILPIDDHRHLVTEGRKQSRKLGKILRALGVEWDRILTSPSMRAVQTAEIVAARLKYRGTVESEAALLAGEGDWAKYLAAARKTGGKDVALVGHEPDLGIALGQALGEGPVALPKGAVAALERDSDGKWKAMGLLRPASSCWEPLGAKGAAAAEASEAHGKREKREEREKRGKPNKQEEPSEQDKHEEQDKAAKQDKHEERGKNEERGKPEKQDKHEKHDRHDKDEVHAKAAKATKSAPTDEAVRTSLATRAGATAQGETSKAEIAVTGKTGTAGKTTKASKGDKSDQAGRKTQPATNAEFVNSAEKVKNASGSRAREKGKTGETPVTSGKTAATRTPRKAGTAFANEEAAARPAGKRSGRPKG